MTWKCWVAIGTLVVLVFLGLYIGKLREQKWLLQDQQRLAEIEEYRIAADESSKSIVATRAKVIVLEGELAVAKLEANTVRTVYRNRKNPKVRTECDDYVEALEEIVAIDQALIMEIDAAFWSSQSRGDNLEQAWLLERERSNHFQKQAKKEKIKRAFIGVGSGAAGALVGIGIGVIVR